MFGLSVAVLLAALQTPGARPADSVTAFVNVAVIPMDREQVLTGQTVLVQGDQISAIGPADQVTVPAQAVRVDGQGKFLIPGLADMHMHLGSGELTDGDWPEFERRLLAFLAYGVTTVRVMDGGPWHVDLRARIVKGEVLGPTLYTAGPLVPAIASPQRAAQLVADYKAAGYDLIKLYQPALTLEVFDTFVAAAQRAKMPFGGHTVRGQVTMEQWLAGHPASIEHLTGYFQYLAVGSPSESHVKKVEWGVLPLDSLRIDEKKIASIAVATKRAGVWNVPTLEIYNNPSLTDGVPPDWHQKVMKFRGRIIKALQDAGAGLLVGTDAVTVDGNLAGLSVHWELEALVTAGLTPYQALAAGTRNVAVFFGTLDKTGTIEVGKRADLLLLAANPLEDIRNSTQITTVMLGGRMFAPAELKSQAEDEGQ